MSVVGDISVRIGLDMTDFQKGMAKAEKSLQATGEKLKGVGEGLSKAVSIPLMAIGGLALSSASDVQKSQALVQAQLGLTGKEAEGLQTTITNLYKKGFGGDISEVTNAVTNIKRNMKEMSDATEQELAKVAESTMNLSTVFGQDVNDITKSINGMQQAFGNISVDKAFDLITTGFQNGLDYSGEFLDSINEYSVHFAEMGFSSEQMFGVFQKGAETGAFQLDKVGDLVKEINIRLSDGTAEEYMSSFSQGTRELYAEFQKTGKGGAELFQSIMKELAECESDTEAYTLGVGLMGTQFEDLDMKAVQALASVTDGFTDVEGATDRLNDAMNKDIGTTLTSAFRELQTALVPVGESFAVLINKYLPPVIEGIRSLGEKFAGLSPKTQLVVVALAGVMAILPPIIIAIGATVSAVGSIAGAFGGMIGTFAKVGGAVKNFVGVFNSMKTALNLTKLLPLVTSPVGLIIVAIGGLIAIGVLVWKNWDEIKAKTIEIWNSISEWLTNTWSSITDYASETWSSIKDGVVNAWNSVLDFLSGLLSSMVNFFTDTWKSITDGVSTAWTTIIDTITTFGSKLYEASGIKPFVDFAIETFNFLKDTLSITIDMIFAIFNAIWLKIRSTVEGIISKLVDSISKSWDKVKSVTNSVMSAVKDFITTIWNAILNVVSPIVSRIIDAVSSGWNKVKSVTSTIFNAIKSFLSTIWNSISSAISSVVNTIFSVISKIWNNVKSTTSSIFNSVKTEATSIWNKLKDSISEVATNIWTTVKDIFGKVKDAIYKPVEEAKELVGDALDAITGFFKNLDWKFPMPKMPKFSVSKGSTTFLGQEIPIPVFNVEWNAKGNIFTGASILGGGQGVGEAGAEVVMPIQRKRYMKPYASMVADLLHQNGGVSSSPSGITQNITINSPEPLTPSEVARQTLQGSRRLALEWGMN